MGQQRRFLRVTPAQPQVIENLDENGLTRRGPSRYNPRLIWRGVEQSGSSSGS
jgi:hypothetical protein